MIRLRACSTATAARTWAAWAMRHPLASAAPSRLWSLYVRLSRSPFVLYVNFNRRLSFLYKFYTHFLAHAPHFYCLIIATGSKEIWMSTCWIYFINNIAVTLITIVEATSWNSGQQLSWVLLPDTDTCILSCSLRSTYDKRSSESWSNNKLAWLRSMPIVSLKALWKWHLLQVPKLKSWLPHIEQQVPSTLWKHHLHHSFVQVWNVIDFRLSLFLWLGMSLCHLLVVFFAKYFRLDVLLQIIEFDDLDLTSGITLSANESIWSHDDLLIKLEACNCSDCLSNILYHISVDTAIFSSDSLFLYLP